MAKYAIGDLVKLKSGSPVMTVSSTFVPFSGHSKDETVYTCKWFAGAKMQKGEFPEQSLIPAPPEDE